MNTTILMVTTFTSGLMAGLFYTWSISVTPGISKVRDENYLQAFQSMNRAIINPIFLICFMGLIILLPLLSFLSSESAHFLYVLSATILYMFGVIAVTFFGNIPLNNSLEALHIESMSIEQMASFRLGFENKWNKLNLLRTISSSASFVFLIIACIHKSS